MGEQQSQSQRAAAGRFALREVAHLLDLSPARVRGWVRAGWVDPPRGPGGALRFSFRDVAFLRRVRDLQAERIPARRVRRALDRLRALGDAAPPSGLALGAAHGQLVVREGATLWSPESGQCVFDFEARAAGRRVVALHPDRAGAPAPCPAPEGRVEPVPETADAWYQVASELVARDEEAARRAYRRALALDPAHADAHLDLGCLEHDRGRLDAAERHYRAVLSLRPKDPTALFDLGVLLEDRGRPDEARRSYEAAVAADPACAEAHYNLARLCEQTGDARTAVRHWTAYRRLSDED